MKISDRTLGYISLLTLFSIFAIIAYSMWDAHHEATTIIQVDFDELGSLQPEDQVVIRGYTVGTIGKVQWLGDRARVEIKFNQPIVIREGTQFNNINYAIMGQRRLEIIPSKTGKVLPDNYIHTGRFEPGIAEVLRYIENVNDQVETIRQIIYLVTNGDSTHRSASALVEYVLQNIEITVFEGQCDITHGVDFRLFGDTIFRFQELVAISSNKTVFGQQGGGFRLRFADAGFEQGEVVGDGLRHFGRVVNGLRLRRQRIDGLVCTS